MNVCIGWQLPLERLNFNVYLFRLVKSANNNAIKHLQSGRIRNVFLKCPWIKLARKLFSHCFRSLFTVATQKKKSVLIFNVHKFFG